MATVISFEPIMVNSKTTYTIPDCGIQAVLSWLCMCHSLKPSFWLSPCPSEFQGLHLIFS